MSKFLIHKLKDSIILFSWMGGLVFIAGLCWFLTRPLRTEFLRYSINHAWIMTGNTLRLEMPVAPGTLEPGLSRLGTWFTLNNGNRALIFTLASGGQFIPCAAIVDSGGKVVEFVPLSSGPGLDRVSPGIVQLHKRRIEGQP